MSSNLPPGCTESNIPGNRPEDQEIEVIITFSIQEIDDLFKFKTEQNKLSQSQKHALAYLVENLTEQLMDYKESLCLL